MSCYFEKCCFDAQEVGTQKECDRLSLDGKHTELTLFLHKKIINTSIDSTENS